MILKKPSGRKYITRLDYPTTHGWWVRILDCRDGKGKVSKYFRDTKYESKEEGLIEATKFRDRYFNRLTRAQKTVEHKHKLGKLYSEGVYSYWFGRSGYEYLYFVATWSDGGRQRRKQFSAHKHGYDDALRMAHAARAEKTQGRIKVYEA